jgi:SAM-dependent methyltransferase
MERRRHCYVERNMYKKLVKWLKLQEAEELSTLDAQSKTERHREIIQRKPFLKRLYTEFYKEFKTVSDEFPNGLLIELGSGGGFIKDVIPNVITSGILHVTGKDVQFSALAMPFKDNTVDVFFIMNVLHHINNAYIFFKELDRCLKIGGEIVITTTANTLWSRFIYKNFHSEPFDPCGGWDFEGTDPLSSANIAIPWIIFFRDRTQFERLFPSLRVRKIRFHTPFRYLVSGGCSVRQLLPPFTYDIVKGLEILLSPLHRHIDMFMTIEIEKVS